MKSDNLPITRLSLLTRFIFSDPVFSPRKARTPRPWLSSFLCPEKCRHARTLIFASVTRGLPEAARARARSTARCGSGHGSRQNQPRSIPYLNSVVIFLLLLDSGGKRMPETMMDILERALSAVIKLCGWLAGSPEYEVRVSKVRVPDLRGFVYANHQLRRSPPSGSACGRY